MCEFNVRIAEYVIAIRALNPGVKNLFRDYLTDEPAQLMLESDESDLAEERRLMKCDPDMRPYVDRYSDGRVESSYLHRSLAELLAEYETILMHGSAVALDGEVYIFVAPSGTGKSTHARLWREAFGDRVVMINDDKPLLKCTGDGILVYGSPWDGKHHLSTNSCAHLKAICFLERGEENVIEQISSGDAFIPLMTAIYHSKDAGRETAILHTLQSIRQHAKFYRLKCNMEPDAAKVSYEGMH